MAKLRIGIIGAGGRGIRSFAAQFVEHYPGRAQVMALADPNALRAKAGLEFLGIEADIHEDAQELVARKDIDAVVVTSPDYLHEEHALMVLRNKKHCFVDKPLATTVQGCVNVVEAAKEARRVLYMGFNLRHNIVVKNLREMARAGHFGDIFSVHAIEYYNGGRSYHCRWNRLKKFSGGLWVHKGSHDFDVINYIMGDVRPARVSCFANVFTFKPENLPFTKRKGVEPGPTCNACPYNRECPDAYMIESDPAHGATGMFTEETAKVDGYYKNLCMYLSDKDTHDQGIAMIEYENGATACHAEYFATPFTNRRYVIEGTLGHGEGDVHGNRVEILPRWTDDRVVHHLQRAGGGHGGTDPLMVAEFVECLQKGRRPTASGIDGAWSVAIGEACEIARAEARVVKISEVLDTRSSLLKPARRGKR